MDGVSEVEQLRAALAARDAHLAVERARRAELEEQVAKRTEAVRVLREMLDRHSSNSNEPPSSDPPGAGARLPKRKKSKGGQKGHRGTHRLLVPAEQLR